MQLKKIDGLNGTLKEAPDHQTEPVESPVLDPLKGNVLKKGVRKWTC